MPVRPSPHKSKIAEVRPPGSTNNESPIFCFRHVVQGFDIEPLSRDQRAHLAMALQQRAKLTWGQINQAPRHGMGTEKIPKEIICGPIPSRFEDRDDFLAFRYSGQLPMVGVRMGPVFHVLWLERAFGELYPHG